MKKTSIVAASLLALLSAGQARAVETDYAAGTRALPLQQAGGTARAMAMGSAVVAVDQESASLLWNPAGLSKMQSMELGLHHNTGLGDTIQEIAIVGVPLGPLGGVAASLGYVTYGSFSGRDASGQQTGSYNSGSFSGSAGWGLELLPGLSGGIVLKASQSNFGSKSYDSYAADAGVLWAVHPRVDLGAVYSNLNLGGKIGGSQLASGWRLGAAWNYNRRFIVSASGELQNSAMDRLQLGTEYRVGDIESKRHVLALRAGIQVSFPDPKVTAMDALTLGLGYTVSRSLAVDYALVPNGDLGVSHRLSLTLKFARYVVPAHEQAP